MSDDLYSLVQRRIWNDARFRKLSKPKPNARDLFLYLLTTPRATPIPGVIALGEPGLAEELEWPLKGVQECLAEVEKAGMLKVDRAARLIWLPNGLKHNPPRSSKNVLGWTIHWRLLPECDLLNEIATTFAASMKARGASFVEAFSRVIGQPLPNRDVDGDAKTDPGEMPSQTGTETASIIPSEMPCPMACQEQEQDQEQDQDTQTHTVAGARVREDEAQRQGPEGRPASDGIPIATTESLLAAVFRHSMLETLHGDKRWAMTLAGVFASGGVRASDVDAAVDAFVADNAAKAPEDDLALADFVRDDRKGIGRYLKSAKVYGDRARRYAAAARDRESDRGGSPGSTPNPHTQAVLELFGKLWTKAKRATFVPSEGDDRHATALVKLASPHVSEPGAGLAIVNHWITKYLDDEDRFLVDHDHPIRLLPKRAGDYKLPPSADPKKAAARSQVPGPPLATEPPPPSAEEAARLALEHRAKIASIGTGSATMPVARPS